MSVQVLVPDTGCGRPKPSEMPSKAGEVVVCGDSSVLLPVGEGYQDNTPPTRSSP